MMAVGGALAIALFAWTDLKLLMLLAAAAALAPADATTTRA